MVAFRDFFAAGWPDVDGRSSSTKLEAFTAPDTFAEPADGNELAREAESTGALDGDGTMVGRVLVYASIVIVAVAMIVWKRSG